MPEMEPRTHLIKRYPHLSDANSARMVSAIASTNYRVEWRDIAVRYDDDLMTELPPASREDALAALRLLQDVRIDLDANERRLIDIARREGATWPQIAKELGYSSPQAAQQRRKRLESATNYRDTLIDPTRTTNPKET